MGETDEKINLHRAGWIKPVFDECYVIMGMPAELRNEQIVL